MPFLLSGFHLSFRHSSRCVRNVVKRKDSITIFNETSVSSEPLAVPFGADVSAHPFIKWVGGKSQLIHEINARLPRDFATYDTYVEPFVGGGAFLFHVLRTYPIKRAVINDLNERLINLYRVIKGNVEDLISCLREIEAQYRALDDSDRKSFYLRVRERFNDTAKSDQVTSASDFIFLNRTCFNGLYRENSKGAFNVPFGRYANPRICDAENLRAAGNQLQRVEILCGDFSETIHYAKGRTLFYFDPPYKPLSNTSSFNSYAKEGFGDQEQIRLATFCRELEFERHDFILSNSDVKGKDADNDFFDDLYAGFDIRRVYAVRSVNANGNKRGRLTELLISNFTNN